MANTKIGGFTFCGLHINNKDGNVGTYKLLEVDRPASPNMTYREYIAPKRNGSKRYDSRYEDIIISVVIGVSGNSIEKQQKITNLLSQWIGKEDKLMFDDRPSLFYKAKFFNSATVDNQGIFTRLSITFIASYCMYELYDDLRDYTVNQLTMAIDDIGMLVNRAEWSGITTSQIKRINNTGNFESQPIIEITGTASLLILEVNNKAFSFMNLNGSVFIDTEQMLVYEIVGTKKVSVLQQFRGLFPSIPIGESDVHIGGTNLNLDITIDFKNTYIV